MEDKAFTWTSDLNKRLLQLRFENDWLFKSKKQPWSEFHKLLLDNGFPSEMTIDHVRKKWSYTYDMYKIAKKTNNKAWKYFKVFDKHFGKNEILDKYESWSDEWRLKLIICVTESKEMKLEPLTMWRTVERAMRCQDLPLDCCVQDMKGLWHHIKMTFGSSERSEWPLYDAMLTYFEKFEPDVLTRLEAQGSCGSRIPCARYFKHNKKNTDKNESENETEFQWQEEWVFNLISARTDLEHTFRTFKDPLHGWREVEKMLRSIGIPLDHSLLDLQEIWLHLMKTFKWKTKFANKGILNEQWPYFEAMSRYSEIQEKNAIKKQKIEETDNYADATNDDDFEDDMKLLDLKQRLQLQVKPKFEEEDDSDRCRSCSNLTASIDIFEQKDDDGFDVAHKLKLIGGIEIEKTDNLPTHICLSCLEILENAYKFRRKCQDIDKMLRGTARRIKVEVLDKHDLNETHNDDKGDDNHDVDEVEITFGQISGDMAEQSENEAKPKVKTEKVRRKKKKVKKLRYDYWKICEICGKHTRNLVSHLDTHSTDKLYSCNVCDKKFKFKSGLIIHKAVHDPTPRKTCEVCGKTFHILAQYRRHFVYHANERKYGCETCGKRFNTLDILKVHHRTHTDERPFSCQECGKTFRTAGCVSRHKRIVHRNIKKVQ
ncbi:hypothetical protein HF086_010041 [Spodoptera exigua]|uniref:Uncharacterized protein n=1 Tax=Spodoptera exigua TaxID=7107 RepID=A0A922SJM7_SPOEX|nr:hypothetical protein HF086_010041 [Spodoptera exigua]